MSIYYSDFNFERYLAFRSKVYERYAENAQIIRNRQGERVNSRKTDQIEISCNDEYGWFDLMFSCSDGRNIQVPLSDFSSPISELRSWMKQMIQCTNPTHRLVSEYIADCEDDYYIFNFEQLNEDGDGIFTIYHSYGFEGASKEDSFDAYCNYKWLVSTLYSTVLQYWQNHEEDKFFSWTIGKYDTDKPQKVASLIKSKIIEDFIQNFEKNKQTGQARCLENV